MPPRDNDHPAEKFRSRGTASKGPDRCERALCACRGPLRGASPATAAEACPGAGEASRTTLSRRHAGPCVATRQQQDSGKGRWRACPGPEPGRASTRRTEASVAVSSARLPRRLPFLAHSRLPFRRRQEEPRAAVCSGLRPARAPLSRPRRRAAASRRPAPVRRDRDQSRAGCGRCPPVSAPSPVRIRS